MVGSNVELTNTTEKKATTQTSSPTQDQAKENLDCLRTRVESWLVVLSDVYGSMGHDFWGLIGEVSTSRAIITRPGETHVAFFKPVQLLKRDLPTVLQGAAKAGAGAGNDIGDAMTTSRDIRSFVVVATHALDGGRRLCLRSA